MTAEQLAELKRLNEEATPGPWESGEIDGGGGFAVHGDGDLRLLVVELPLNGFPPDKFVEADAALIAAMRNALPAILSTAERCAELERDEAAAEELAGALKLAQHDAHLWHGHMNVGQVEVPQAECRLPSCVAAREARSRAQAHDAMHRAEAAERFEVE